MRVLLSLYISLIIILITACDPKPNTNAANNELIKKDSVIEIPKLYNIALDQYQVEKSTVKQNQTIGDILGDAGIDYPLILKASDMDSIFDIRRIRAGQDITYFYNKSDSARLDYFVYEIDRQRYVVFDFKDSVNMYVGEKPIEHRLRQISGRIKSSLWNAMTEIHVDPMLAIELSEVYAWSIDFFGLQKDDHFSVIYEENYIDSTFYSIEKIDAIRFDHAGHYYYAFRFKQDSVWSFYDEKGNSLRKAFLKAPLKYSRISSRFSNSRMHPVLKIRRPHHGVDYAAPKGTPVYSVGDGKVIAKGWDKGGGRYVKIKHNSVYTTVYMHFSKFGDINEGDFVHQGEVIGYVGSSGLATGPHLDFRFFMNGKPIDPLTVKSPPVQPIKDSLKEEYLKVVEKYQKTLDSLIHSVETDSIPESPSE
ncbi:MAG: peptidoglycan DD-metalloendopeptidase family protein [Bacteroidales bacterium]|nr:peptidoglycan DD-metalloendopeptidase family protein [Bacteroidales bacterium]